MLHALLGIDPSLTKLIFDTELGQCQQQPETDILCRQMFARR